MNKIIIWTVPNISIENKINLSDKLKYYLLDSFLNFNKKINLQFSPKAMEY